jgi:hypothetical protein
MYIKSTKKMSCDQNPRNLVANEQASCLMHVGRMQVRQVIAPIANDGSGNGWF